MGYTSIDILEVTVKTPTQEVGKTFGNIPSGEPGTVHTIRVPMESIHEDLLVTYKVHDRGDTDGVAQQSGHRDLPDSLVKQWAPGSKNDPEETLTYHFKKHKKEIGTDSIYTYCERAILLRNSLKASEYVRDVGGATPNSKRYERNDYYIVVSGNRNTGLIVMYGKIIRT